MVGIKTASNALDGDHGLLQQHQLGPQPHLEQGGDLEQLGQQPAHGDLAGRPAEHRLADRAQGLGEGVDIVVARHIAGVEMHLGHPAIVAHQEAVEDLGQEAPLDRSQPADDAEVDGGDRRGGGDEQVSLVKVGVEHPVIHRLGQKAADEVVGQGPAVQARRVQRRRVRQRQPARPFQGQHPLAHALPDHGRRPHVAVAGHDLAHLAGPGGLHAQVQLQLQRADDDPGEQHRLQPAGRGDQPLDQTGDQQQHAAVGVDAPLDPRPQHLHRHPTAVEHRGLMGLGDGGGGDRLAEGRVETLDRPPQRALDLGPGDGGVEGRQTVLEVRQVLGELAAEDVGAGRQHLAQLDGDGAEALQRPGQPLARPPDPGPGAREQPQEPAQRPHPRRQQRIDLARDQRIGADQRPADGQQAGECGKVHA